MSKIATRTAAAPRAAAAARPARQSAAAAAKAAPVTRRLTLVSIDGGPFVEVPFSLADFARHDDFALDVVASIAFAHTGLVMTGLREIGGAGRLYSGTFNAGRKQVAFAFKSAPAVSAPVETAKADKPAPVAAPKADARPAKSLPAPAVAAALKAASADAKAARAIKRVRITFQNAGSYDVRASEAELANPAEFARLYIANRAAEYHEWPRVTIDYANRYGADAYNGAVSHGASRQVVTWGVIGDDVPAAPVALPKRRGMGLAPRVDALATAMGKGPALASAEQKAKAAGIKLSPQDRRLAEVSDAAKAKALAPSRIEARGLSAANRAILEAAGTGVLPTAPDFSAPTHERYRGKLAELVALVNAGDIARLEAYVINAISTSPKALDRYRNAAVVALRAKAAKREARAAKRAA